MRSVAIMQPTFSIWCCIPWRLIMLKDIALTSLAAIFGGNDEEPESKEPESEKLLNLYWNRAELKKEFAELRNEKFRLQERLKEQEGATARLEQKLQHLENLLLDSDWVYNIVTFFQLRRLALSGETRLAKFAEQLKQQRELKVQNQLQSQWNEQRAAEAARVEREIGEHRLGVQMLEDRLQVESAREASMSRLARLFFGRSAQARLNELTANIDLAAEQERRLLHRLEEIEKQPPPDTQGLDVATKRLINFMIISFAQQLYLHFCDDELAEQAKQASETSIGAVRYGDKAACDQVLGRIRKQLDSLEKATEFADVLKRRAKMIGEKAVFRTSEDAVPTSASVSTVYAIDKKGQVQTLEINLLRENYWNLNAVVSR
ncbi:MAG: hypothetical protein OEW64_02680 [Gammaproteobacteria bacterium]|nr:hypothetical protein [Gammaproteobacteria bacterium]MDH5302984.1 hypothetical protein [Gammaproteobacteria bacterium]MDH5321269.1 hypothetical protein [Gammaproteobacteria bacterium]